MVGPALLLLFDELDKRKDNLTAFEDALHKELLATLPKPTTPKPAFRGAADLAGKLTEEIDRPLDLAHGQPRFTRKRRGGDFGLEAGLPGSSGVPQLQINCSQTNCPNKKRT